MKCIQWLGRYLADTDCNKKDRNKAMLTLIASILLLSACAGKPVQEENQQSVEPRPAVLVIEEEPTVEIATRPFPGDSLYDLLVAEFSVRRGRFDIALGTYLQQAHATQDSAVAARATRLAQHLRADNAILDASLLWSELDPDNLEAQYTAATALAKNHRPIEALQHMVAVLERGGVTNFAAIIANSLSLATEKVLEIEAFIDRWIEQYPHNAQLLTAKSLLLQNRGDGENALTLIQQVLTIDPDDLHAIVVEARMLMQQKRIEEVFLRLEPAVENNPRNRRLRLEYARLLMRDDIAKAQTQFERLLVQTPGDPDLLLSLALINKETHNYAQATLYFEQLLVIDARADEARLHLGQLAERDNNWRKAIEYYAAVTPGRYFLSASNRIIDLYLDRGMVETARAHLQKLRQQYTQHSVSIYLLEADLLLRSDLYEDGHKLLSEALLLNPEQLNLLYIRSLFSEKRADLKLMEKDLRLIIDLDPKNSTALNALGYVLANSATRLDEAYEFIKRAIALKPNEPAIMDSLGWVEYRRGNLQESLEILKKAYKAFPDHEIAAHLGEVMWALGQQQKARQTWAQALKKSPDSAIILETVNRLSQSTSVQ